MTKKIAQIHLDEDDIEFVCNVLAKEFADVFAYYTDKPIEGFAHFQKIMQPIIKRVLLAAPSFHDIEIPESLGEELQGKLKEEKSMKDRKERLAQVPLISDEEMQKNIDKVEKKVKHLGVDDELGVSLGIDEEPRQMYPMAYVAERLVRAVEKTLYSSMQAAYDDVTAEAARVYGRFDDASREELAQLLNRMGYKVMTKAKEKDKRMAGKAEAQDDADIHGKLDRIIGYLDFLVKRFGEQKAQKGDN